MTVKRMQNSARKIRYSHIKITKYHIFSLELTGNPCEGFVIPHCNPEKQNEIF